MGKWADRLRAAERESTDKTDKTRPASGVLSVLSVNRRSAEVPSGGFVSFVGESVARETVRDDGVCTRHHRHLTYREFRDRRCCWCHPEDRPEWRDRPDVLAALAEINAAAPQSTDKTDETLSCLDCGARLEAGRKYRCPACVEVAVSVTGRLRP
ncbi:MAG: hypothetical protein H0V51_17640 [Chloroflexi bacterium]|nr:hypothetical protein [Chloroflexota bacterium]